LFSVATWKLPRNAGLSTDAVGRAEVVPLGVGLDDDPKRKVGTVAVGVGNDEAADPIPKLTAAGSLDDTEPPSTIGVLFSDLVLENEKPDAATATGTEVAKEDAGGSMEPVLGPNKLSEGFTNGVVALLS
jgi:hypothetical protein